MTKEQIEIAKELLYEVGTLNSGVSALMEKDFATESDSVDRLTAAVEELNESIKTLPSQIAEAVAGAVQHLS